MSNGECLRSAVEPTRTELSAGDATNGEDDADTLVLYPLSTPNGPSPQPASTNSQPARTPPIKSPPKKVCFELQPVPGSMPRQVLSNTRRAVQREVLGDVVKAAVRRLQKQAFWSWREQSGFPARTPSILLAEVMAMAEWQLADAKAHETPQGTHFAQDAPSERRREVQYAEADETRDETADADHSVKDEAVVDDAVADYGDYDDSQEADATDSLRSLHELSSRLDHLAERVARLERSSRWLCAGLLLVSSAAVIHVTLAFVVLRGTALSCGARTH